MILFLRFARELVFAHDMRIDHAPHSLGHSSKSLHQNSEPYIADDEKVEVAVGSSLARTDGSEYERQLHARTRKRCSK